MVLIAPGRKPRPGFSGRSTLQRPAADSSDPPGEQVRVLVFLNSDMSGDPGEVHLKKGPQGLELPPHRVNQVLVGFGESTLVKDTDSILAVGVDD